MKLVEELTVSGIDPRGILTSLKAKFPNNHSTMRTIYNARERLNLIACQGRNIMQQFMVLSEDRHYTVEYNYDEKTNEVTDLFFAHHKFVKLAQSFHEFLIPDCTFKTNRYKLPIFQMVSHTSTGATFTVAVAFLSREQEENYVLIWDVFGVGITVSKICRYLGYLLLLVSYC
ncbi:uncharacterized protein LOC113342544 [Papaver somniferum]|uniref:uncharacterized protein LOC113342544 n=1 Tax=Papaver somniferum TaxID=3469 RepID=UPI000E6FE552|nr:uncharacterized protein LOC113342544 [Papaver somniferum]